MKLDILIVEIIVVAAVAVPYLTFIILGLRENADLKKKFSEEVAGLNLRLAEKELWNKNIMGLDKEKRQMLFLQKRTAGIAVTHIDLRLVTSCSILEETRTYAINDQPRTDLEKLQLQLWLPDGSSQLVTLYDCGETYWQDYELQHAEKWKARINSLLGEQRLVPAA